MKKKLALLALVSIVGVSHAVGDYSDMKKYGLGLVALAASKYILDEIGKIDALKGVCESANLSATDIGNVGGLSIGLATLGFMTANEKEQSVLYNKALSVPVAATVLWIASTKVFRGIAQKLPVIGEYFVCPNEDCKGSCKDCKLTKGLLGLGSYMNARDVLFNKDDADGDDD